MYVQHLVFRSSTTSVLIDHILYFSQDRRSETLTGVIINIVLQRQTYAIIEIYDRNFLKNTLVVLYNYT